MASVDRTDHIVSRFLLKSLHLVLSSRIPSNVLLLDRDVDRSLNLSQAGPPPPFDGPDLQNGNLAIDIVLWCRADCEAAVIERWIVAYQPAPSPEQRCSDRRSCRNSMVLLRSIYLLLRLLPAYKAFRILGDDGSRSRDFRLTYRVSASSWREELVEDETRRYGFAPVQTRSGQVSVSVIYLPTLSGFDLGRSPPLLFPGRIISDYVGSPVVEPVRAFSYNSGSVFWQADVADDPGRRRSWGGSSSSAGLRMAMGAVEPSTILTPPFRSSSPLELHKWQFLLLRESRVAGRSRGRSQGYCLQEVRLRGDLPRFRAGCLSRIVLMVYPLPWMTWIHQLPTPGNIPLIDTWPLVIRNKNIAAGLLVSVLHPKQHLSQSIPKSDGSSSLSRSFKTSDALEELQGYRGLKECLLLHKGGNHMDFAIKP